MNEGARTKEVVKEQTAAVGKIYSLTGMKSNCGANLSFERHGGLASRSRYAVEGLLYALETRKNW
jgi:hypothetical protein